MPLQDDYQVSLDMFKGPLDLLLYLIRRAEVDIHDIPIASITDQYLTFLKQIDHVDIDLAGEFLVMAATLIEIKSRTLMPPGQLVGEGDDAAGGIASGSESDPRFELVQQLLAYQRYRIAAEELDKHRELFQRRFPAASHAPGLSESPDVDATGPMEGELSYMPSEIELEDAHVLDLFGAYERIISSVDFSRMGDHTVEMDDTPIALHQEDLLDRLTRATERRITLQEAFEGRSRVQMIGLFLATLELVRVRRLLVKQDKINGEIVLELNDDPDVLSVSTEAQKTEPRMNADEREEES